MKTKVISVNPVVPEPQRIAEAARVIRQGGLVIFPTETVYGIAADLSNPSAIARLRQVKQRSEDKPFSILISHRRIIENYTSYTDPKLYKLIDKYWPGPLTVIVPAKEPGKSYGIRMPDNTIALNLVDAAQSAIAAPSANIEGKKAPTTCQEALEDLDGLVDLAIDGGPVELGISSSIVDFTQADPKVIRDGVITQYDVDRTTQKKIILFVCTGNSCRSVMAEYLLKDMVKERKDVEVLSAGTGVLYRSPASAETIAVLKQRGINAYSHLASPVGSLMLKKADLIFVMTRTHRMQVLDIVPNVEKRVYLLKEFANIPKGSEMDLDIPDPIGRPHGAYEECLLTIQEAILKIVQLI